MIPFLYLATSISNGLVIHPDNWMLWIGSSCGGTYCSCYRFVPVVWTCNNYNNIGADTWSSLVSGRSSFDPVATGGQGEHWMEVTLWYIWSCNWSSVSVYPYTPFVVLSLLVIILGILSIVYGGLRLLWALRGGGLGMAILGFLMIALGILLLINPLAGAVVFPWIYGIFLVLGEIAALIGGIRMRSEKKSRTQVKNKNIC